jgi:hypothetical protein
MLYTLIFNGMRKEVKVYGEIKGENVGLISPPMGPTAHWALARVRIGDAQPVRRLVGPCRAAL